MSENIKHECGISLLRLLKPLDYYREKYGTSLYGINKMYLMMEKQHNRGQDGAGFASIKLDMEPGQRYISRVRSIEQTPIQDIFRQINERIGQVVDEEPELLKQPEELKKHVPYLGEVYLGHVRYGTFGRNGIESVHPFLRQNNWMHRNLIVAGNFNMTNVGELFNNLVELGQHPKEMADTVTVMERIGHFLDDAVAKLYKEIKKEGYSKKEASPLIAQRLNLIKILEKASKNWDGGYVMAGMIGHGDAFVLRDPAGIRPAYYYKDDEVVVVASERPAIQTAFDVPYSEVHELEPAHGLVVKRNGEMLINQILEPLTRKACSFERIYFSRGSDLEIYRERKDLGKRIFKKVLDSVGSDLDNTVFSYIPNTAETAFLGITEEAQKYLNIKKEEQIRALGSNPSSEDIHRILEVQPRIEKVTIKDAKMRTFISQDEGRNDLVAHVYDITYGSVGPGDNLVIVDDSIVRGTTLQRSILRMLDRLGPRRIIVVSSAPQIRYPDCYGIDMAKLEDFAAFRAALSLHEKRGSKQTILEEVYTRSQELLAADSPISENAVRRIYDAFTEEEISEEIGSMLSPANIKAEIQIIYQTVEDLHAACPHNLGDWYFTGDYPTPGGMRVVHRAFVNFYEGKNRRAY